MQVPLFTFDSSAGLPLELLPAALERATRAQAEILNYMQRCLQQVGDLPKLPCAMSAAKALALFASLATSAMQQPEMLTGCIVTKQAGMGSST